MGILGLVQSYARSYLLSSRVDVRAAAVQRGADAFGFADQLAEEEAEEEVRDAVPGTPPWLIETIAAAEAYNVGLGTEIISEASDGAVVPAGSVPDPCAGPSMCTADCARFGCRRDTAYGTSGQPEDLVPEAPASVSSDHNSMFSRGDFKFCPRGCGHWAAVHGPSGCHMMVVGEPCGCRWIPEFVGSGVEAIPVKPSPQETTPEPTPRETFTVLYEVLAKHKPVEQPDGTVRCYLSYDDEGRGEGYRDWPSWYRHVTQCAVDALSSAAFNTSGLNDSQTRAIRDLVDRLKAQ